MLALGSSGWSRGLDDIAFVPAAQVLSVSGFEQVPFEPIQESHQSASAVASRSLAWSARPRCLNPRLTRCLAFASLHSSCFATSE